MCKRGRCGCVVPPHSSGICALGEGAAEFVKRGTGELLVVDSTGPLPVLTVHVTSLPVNVTGVVSRDAALPLYGGRVHGQAGSRVRLAWLAFSGQDMEGSIGGALITEGFVHVSNAHFSNNTASYGGAIYGSRSSTIVLFNVTCDNNIATSGGGAVYCAGHLDVLCTHFTMNDAPIGGALYATRFFPTPHGFILLS